MPTLYITKLFECKQKLTGLRAFLEKTSLVAWWLSGVVCRLDRKTVNRRREIRSWNSGAESPERPESETGETDTQSLCYRVLQHWLLSSEHSISIQCTVNMARFYCPIKLLEHGEISEYAPGCKYRFHYLIFIDWIRNRLFEVNGNFLEYDFWTPPLLSILYMDLVRHGYNWPCGRNARPPSLS